jgi:hypothetical protein
MFYQQPGRGTEGDGWSEYLAPAEPDEHEDSVNAVRAELSPQRPRLGVRRAAAGAAAADTAVSVEGRQIRSSGQRRDRTDGRDRDDGRDRMCATANFSKVVRYEPQGGPFGCR